MAPATPTDPNPSNSAGFDLILAAYAADPNCADILPYLLQDGDPTAQQDYAISPAEARVVLLFVTDDAGAAADLATARTEADHISECTQAGWRTLAPDYTMTAVGEGTLPELPVEGYWQRFHVTVFGTDLDVAHLTLRSGPARVTMVNFATITDEEVIAIAIDLAGRLAAATGQ